MKYALTGLAAAAALAAVADPSDRRRWLARRVLGRRLGPGFGVYVGPRPYYRNYGYGYGYRPYYRDSYAYRYGPRWKYRRGWY
ncbi:MAG: hypothetical protein ACXWVI_04145 [Methyloceanibacter sp.]